MSGLDHEGDLGAPNLSDGKFLLRQNRVGSFDTSDFTIAKKITFDNGTVMSAYFNMHNAFNAIPPGLLGSSSNPGGINAPIGEDLMGRYFIIGVRGDL